LRNTGDHFPSLGVDILNGGETEIDYNNGKIVDYGRKHYIQTPLNLTFTNLVNAVSNKNLGKILKIYKM
jgi:2-dehydropantoate 2-reductase